MLWEALEAFRDQVSDRSASFGEDTGLAPLLIVERDQSARIDRSKRHVGEPASADSAKCLQAMPDRERLLTSQKEISSDVDSLHILTAQLRQDRLECVEIPVDVREKGDRSALGGMRHAKTIAFVA